MKHLAFILAWKVLIETSWNVKKEEAATLATYCSINRNIVECKVHTKWLDPKSVIVLIETSWNVKCKKI